MKMRKPADAILINHAGCCVGWRGGNKIKPKNQPTNLRRPQSSHYAARPIIFHGRFCHRRGRNPLRQFINNLPEYHLGSFITCFAPALGSRPFPWVSPGRRRLCARAPSPKCELNFHASFLPRNYFALSARKVKQHCESCTRSLSRKLPARSHREIWLSI
jgi:hypothetical protein